LEATLDAERAKRAEVEKEQEDLLVLLDELSGKRTRDKQRMREQDMEVSDDEDDDDDEGEDGEEEQEN
jgi:intracellular protein transport protein USO1